MKQGDLITAARFARRERFDTNSRGRKLLTQLTDALIGQASDNISTGKIRRAWTAITAASDVAMLTDRDRISREKNSLVELTVEAANELLAHARTTSVLQLVKELKGRAIRDWRAERIEQVAVLIQRSEEASARGEFELAVELMSRALELRPDLAFLESRMATCQIHAAQMKQLTTALKAALLETRRKDVEQICREMLVLAPNFQLAVDAHRQMAQIPKRAWQQSPSSSLLLSANPSSSRARTTYAGICAADQNDSNPKDGDPAVGTDSVTFMNIDANTKNKQMDANGKPFMIWIDAVGGFLVCPGTSNVIGQAVPNHNVQIPMLGDLQRCHLRIDSLDGAHILHPLGRTSVDGRPIEQQHGLSHGQIIELDGGVQLEYQKTHPLSATAFLSFVSRHRTLPWSDGVLLASGPVMLGPDPRSHVHCPRWKNQLMLFNRDGIWSLRTSGAIEIDSAVHQGQGPIQLNSQIRSEDFSLAFEIINQQ